MLVHNNIQQQTPEWYAIRGLKMTASHAQAVASAGKGLETYTDEIVCEHYSTATREVYMNADMERGNELEPIARGVYELETGNSVTEVGFIQYDDYSGCSPDGLIGEEGGLEIKALSDLIYFRHLMNGADEIESKYLWQVQMNLLITGRAWWDFVAYNPNFAKSIFIHRIYPVKEMQEKLLKGLEVGREQIKSKCKKMKKLLK